MPIVKNKDPWWTTFKIVLFLLLAISVWSLIFAPVPNNKPNIQGK